MSGENFFIKLKEFSRIDILSSATASLTLDGGGTEGVGDSTSESPCQGNGRRQAGKISTLHTLVDQHRNKTAATETC
jgi:hypothetical protein